ncbi:hypothetical protein NQ317_014052 [Molorchus minor]|uniref:Uncharacterized protein n=1 Tax=Molorchus minor TaxID=1323400 RepID=A0ABQ9JXQ9_9CUCU|nr:hypothetical protein NQ317_014052 [Molorchus minor]
MMIRVVQKHDSSHIPNSGEILEWNLNDSHNQKVNISDLKRRVEELESEKKELITQLEQLDSENQQNLLKIISVKDKLQQENNDLKHKYKELKEQNDVLIKKQKELENEAKEEEERTTSSSHEYSKKYESYLQENQSLKLKFEEADKEICVLKSNNDTLQKILEESKIANQEEMRTATESIKRLESENKIIYLELQKAKDDINRYEKKSSEDAENCQKLAFILESYDKQVSSLKKELEETNEKLQTNGNNDEITKKLKEVESINKNNEKEIQSLVKEVEDLNILNKQLQGNNEQLAKENLKITEQFKTYENNQAKLISSLKEKNNKLQTDKSNNESLATLERKLDDFKDDQRNILLQLHKKYVSIITENIRKIQDCGKPSDFEHCEPKDVDPQIGEFSKHVEDILKILLDFKCKCEALEKKVYDLSEERTNILTEKNHEIEKLMQNSEILSHEVIVKTQIIKDFENECNDLVKNNELLINELETYKNNSCLQPISESNEDNMVLLETQLENANKRIEDLEKIIDDFERQQKKKYRITIRE